MKLIKKYKGAKDINFLVEGYSEIRYNILDSLIENLLPKIGAESMKVYTGCCMGFDSHRIKGKIMDGFSYSLKNPDLNKLEDYLRRCEIVND